MKTILIPVDGSDYSKRAIEMGEKVAKAFGSSIILLNVVHVNSTIYGMGHTIVPVDDINSINEGIRKQAEEMLENSKKMLADTGNKVETVTLEGDIAGSIIGYINSNDIDLVVMGSHGLGAVLNRLIVGSVTTKVLHHVQKPVLVVK